MDFSQLSKETMELSEQIGKKQLQLLFDENYFCRDISLTDDKEEVPSSFGAGIAFFLDKGTGSFCLRGEALSSSELLSNKKELEELNSHFRKTEQLHWFGCESYGQAQIIVDQMMNRRFPYEHQMICNISDPGGNWWFERSEEKFSIYFKSMGRAGDLQNIGPLGDLEVAKYQWEKAEQIFEQRETEVELRVQEHSLEMSLKSGERNSSTLERVSNIFQKGVNSFNKNDFSNSMEELSLFLYINELAQIRKFWLDVEELLDTGL